MLPACCVGRVVVMVVALVLPAQQLGLQWMPREL